MSIVWQMTACASRGLTRRLQLPDGVGPVPGIFQEAGYYTCIGSGLPGVDASGNPAKTIRLGKTDYNFDWDLKIFTDHGISHARGKQFLNDEGTHIPLVIRGAGIASRKTRTGLVEHIDIAALSLAAAGIELSAKMRGRNILAQSYQPEQAVFAARDRCGEAADRIRSVRTDRYLYVRNFYSQRPHLMPSSYKDGKLIVQRLHELHAQAKLSPLSERLLFALTRPAEELFHYGQDRWQTKNLSNDPAHAEVLLGHRASLDCWVNETNDSGSETPDVYVLETEDQMKSTRNKASRENFRRNVELYQRWAREGK